MASSEKITQLLEAIKSEIKSNFTNFNQVEVQKKLEEYPCLPAFLFKPVSFEESLKSTNHVIVRFEGFVCLDELEEDVEIDIVKLCYELKDFIQDNKWNKTAFSGGEFIAAVEDEIPELTGMYVWRIEWEQIV